MFNIFVHSYPGLPPVNELILEVKARLVIMMGKCPIDHQTFVVIVVVKSLAMNKSEKRQGLAHIKTKVFTYSLSPLDHLKVVNVNRLLSLQGESPGTPLQVIR